MKVDDKQAMIAYAIPRWHYTCVRHCNVGSRPYPVNWELATEESRTDPFSCVRSYHLFHVQASFLRKSFTNGLPIYILIRVETYHNSIASCTPLLQEMNEIFPELSARACPVILLVHDEKTTLLLVAGAAIRTFIRARVVPAHNPCLYPFPFE
jgi:hypothetical protein